MTMSINKLMINDGAAIYYSPSWMRMMESHMAYLREQSAQNVVAVSPHQAYKFEGDLFGLLHQLKVSSQFHWLTMRLNDMTSPTQLTSSREMLVLPDFPIVDNLLKVFKTASKKIN